MFVFRLTKCFVSEQSLDKINEGGRHPFLGSVGPPRGPVGRPGTLAGASCGGFGSGPGSSTCLGRKKPAASDPTWLLSAFAASSSSLSLSWKSLPQFRQLWWGLIRLNSGLTCATLPDTQASSRGELGEARSARDSPASPSPQRLYCRGGSFLTQPIPAVPGLLGEGELVGGRVLHKAELGGSFAACRSRCRGLQPAPSPPRASCRRSESILQFCVLLDFVCTG